MCRIRSKILSCFFFLFNKSEVQVFKYRELIGYIIKDNMFIFRAEEPWRNNNLSTETKLYSRPPWKFRLCLSKMWKDVKNKIGL